MSNGFRPVFTTTHLITGEAPPPDFPTDERVRVDGDREVIVEANATPGE